METCRRESLEEVGIVIDNVRPLGLEVPAEHPMGPKRDHLYRGTHTVYYRADFVRYDRRLLGADGDAMRFTWELPLEAIAMIEKGPDVRFNDVRTAALQMIREPHTGPAKVWSW